MNAEFQERLAVAEQVIRDRGVPERFFGNWEVRWLRRRGIGCPPWILFPAWKLFAIWFVLYLPLFGVLFLLRELRPHDPPQVFDPSVPLAAIMMSAVTAMGATAGLATFRWRYSLPTWNRIHDA